MERITARHIDRFCTVLNRAFKASEQYKTSAGAINVGHFYREEQSGLKRIVRITNSGGATEDIATGSTFRECYDAAHAWWKGWLYAEDKRNKPRPLGPTENIGSCGSTDG